jgi:hypothetical protein
VKVTAGSSTIVKIMMQKQEGIVSRRLQQISFR